MRIVLYGASIVERLIRFQNEFILLMINYLYGYGNVYLLYVVLLVRYARWEAVYVDQCMVQSINIYINKIITRIISSSISLLEQQFYFAFLLCCFNNLNRTSRTERVWIFTIFGKNVSLLFHPLHDVISCSKETNSWLYSRSPLKWAQVNMVFFYKIVAI